jgi:hypothetical protein
MGGLHSLDFEFTIGLQFICFFLFSFKFILQSPNKQQDVEPGKIQM